MQSIILFHIFRTKKDIKNELKNELRHSQIASHIQQSAILNFAYPLFMSTDSQYASLVILLARFNDHIFISSRRNNTFVSTPKSSNPTVHSSCPTSAYRNRPVIPLKIPFNTLICPGSS